MRWRAAAALALAAAAAFAATAAPSAAELRRSRARADALFRRGTASKNATALLQARDAYREAYDASNGTDTEAFWSFTHAAQVTAGFDHYPSADEVKAVVDFELSRPSGGTQITQLAAISFLDAHTFERVAAAWSAAFEGRPLLSAAQLAARRTALQSKAAALLARGAAGNVAVPSSEVLSVGYLTGHGGHHPVGHHIGGLLRGHDRARFRVVCLFTGRDDGSSYARDNAAACDAVVHLSISDPSAAAKRVASMDLDVLLHLDGYDVGHSMAVMGRRPAPLQVTFFGFLATTGAAYIDAIVGDEWSIPPGGHEGHYAERVLRHPTTFFVQDYARIHAEVLLDRGSGSGDWTGSHRALAAPAAEAAVAVDGEAAQSTPAGATTAPAAAEAARLLAKAYGSLAADAPRPFAFCNFNQLMKLQPGIWSTWLGLLKRAPAAHLWLLAYPPVAAETLMAQLNGTADASLGARIHFLELLPWDQHLLVKRRLCDLFLDTPHYNGHTSVADALWAGIPVLAVATPPADAGHDGSAAGEADPATAEAATDSRGPPLMAGRAAASLVAAAGAPRQFIARDMAEYVTTALAVYEHHRSDVADAVGWQAWRPSPSAPLFDLQGWVPAYEEMLLRAAAVAAGT